MLTEGGLEGDGDDKERGGSGSEGRHRRFSPAFCLCRRALGRRPGWLDPGKDVDVEPDRDTILASCRGNKGGLGRPQRRRTRKIEEWSRCLRCSRRGAVHGVALVRDG
jgi:hypothetical protein